jgi:hypothetical protein
MLSSSSSSSRRKKKRKKRREEEKAETNGNFSTASFGQTDGSTARVSKHVFLVETFNLHNAC